MKTMATTSSCSHSSIQSVFLSAILVAITTTVLHSQCAEARLIDLSHAQTNETYMSTPDQPKYATELIFEGQLAPGVYAKWSSYSLAEHGGTHMDAPLHFSKGGYSVADIPLENTIVDGVMIDCSEEAAKDPAYMLTLQKVLDWEEQYGKIPKKAGVVLNFNWSRKFLNSAEYLNPTDPADYSTFRFPSVSSEAANFLVDERDINILALDTMSPDLMNTAFPVHVKLLSNNRVIVENIKDAQLLPPNCFRLHASPVKFVGGTGVQTRVYAVVDDDCQGSGSGRGLATTCCSLLLTVLMAFMGYLLF